MTKDPIDLFNTEDQDLAGDGDTYIPPDEPLGAKSFGTTLREEREGEGFARRMRHTQPEDVDNPGFDPTRAGQLVQPGDEDVDDIDDESNTIAIDQLRDSNDLSAEEAAMHVVDDRA